MAAGHNLPNGLLIILHLHLLNYPLQDAAGYDERLFDSSRGMRDRNKAMEDITYFLVGKAEGGKERAKSILPTYPCLQPSDTTAFRIALSKYLEALRGAVAHTTHATDNKGKRPASANNDEATAWWWKDVVVRKSILDECSGDRFERLILALSSHAVLKNNTRMSSLSPPSARDHERDLGELSRVYTTRLAAVQTARLEWERSAALLLRRQQDLAEIRARISDPKLAGPSKYESLTIDRLLALRASKYQDLLHGSWKGEDSRSALRLITELAGLLDPSVPVAPKSISKEAETGAENPSHLQAGFETPPPPLPIAAAHHPAHLHSLRLPLFPKSRPSHSAGIKAIDDGQGSISTPPHAVVERLAAIEKIQSSLRSALASAQSTHEQLQHQLQKGGRKDAAHLPSDQMMSSQIRLDAGLWNRRTGRTINFKTLIDPSSLARFGLASPTSENTIEDRIAHIRTNLLPLFTADPLSASDSEPEPEPPKKHRISRVPQPSFRAQPSAGPHRGGVPAATRPINVPKLNPVAPAKQMRVAEGQKPTGTQVPSASHKGDSKAIAQPRTMSRRASAARTRRSTMFGRGEDAEILRIVNSVQDRSDSEGEEGLVFVEDDSPAKLARTPLPRTPLKTQITRGTLLSSVKKSGPRQSFDIEKYERFNVPRLPSLHLETAYEHEGQEDEGYFIAEAEAADCANDDDATDVSAEHEAVYEGNSITLADILLQAGHQGNTSVQLMQEGELEDDMSDWE